MGRLFENGFCVHVPRAMGRLLRRLVDFRSYLVAFALHRSLSVVMFWHGMRECSSEARKPPSPWQTGTVGECGFGPFRGVLDLTTNPPQRQQSQNMKINDLGSGALSASPRSGTFFSLAATPPPHPDSDHAESDQKSLTILIRKMNLWG